MPALPGEQHNEVQYSAGQGQKMPQTAAAAASGPGGSGCPQKGTLQRSRHTFRVGTAPETTVKSPGHQQYTFLLVMKKEEGTGGNVCVLSVTDHYSLTLPKIFLLKIFTSQSPASFICQFPKSEIASLLKRSE